MKKIILVTSILTILLVTPNTFAESGTIVDESKSIKEIQKNIEKLHEDKNNINNELTILTENNNFVLFLVKNGYFRTNITSNELNNIEYLVKRYNISFSDINNKLVDKSKNLEDVSDEKKLLLDLKKELYQDFIPYISQNKYLDYLEFIKGDAVILKKDSDVKYNLLKNKEILNNKVTKIEEKIVIERKKMSEQLRERVGKKIDESIEAIRNNPKYISLNPELRKQVIKTTITKVQDKIVSTQELDNNDSILFQKIEIYQLLEKKLQLFYDSLSEEQKNEGE